MQHGPQGYKPLREFIVSKLAQRSGISTSVDNILITSGSGQALNLVNAVLCEPGDTVLFEQFSYASAITRIRNIGVNPIGVPLDKNGMRMDLLEEKLIELQAKSIKPKYLYVIPTVQNPGGSIMPEENRQELLRLARKFDFAASVGSDFHRLNATWASIGRLPALPGICRPIWSDWLS